MQPGDRADVLIVDDNDDAGALLGSALDAVGYRTAVAISGDAALGMLGGFTPRAALLDIGLPGMDGYELAGALRARLPSVRLIALTGYGGADERARSVAAGFDAHLVKPVPVEAVRAALARLLSPDP
jgi:CheY-like chemotaxis protein